jgi:hypothetical protein
MSGCVGRGRRRRLQFFFDSPALSVKRAKITLVYSLFTKKSLTLSRAFHFLSVCFHFKISWRNPRTRTCTKKCSFSCTAARIDILSSLSFVHTQLDSLSHSHGCNVLCAKESRAVCTKKEKIFSASLVFI